MIFFKKFFSGEGGVGKKGGGMVGVGGGEKIGGVLGEKDLKKDHDGDDRGEG